MIVCAISENVILKLQINTSQSLTCIRNLRWINETNSSLTYWINYIFFPFFFFRLLHFLVLWLKSYHYIVIFECYMYNAHSATETNTFISKLKLTEFSYCYGNIKKHFYSLCFTCDFFRFYYSKFFTQNSLKYF